MPIMYDAPVQPVDLIEFIRRVPLPANLTLSNLFPTTTRGTNKVNFSEITKTNRTARFRSPDGRIHAADRDGYSDKVITMPPLSDSRSVGEYERLALENLRLGGTRPQALIDAIYDDGADLTRYVQNRMELAIGDVLTDGKFTPSELGGAETDFGVPGSHLITVGTSWATVASSDPFADLVGACDIYEATNGFRPGFAISARQSLRQMQTSTKMINAIKGAQTGSTRVSQQQIMDLFDGEGVPTNWIINETQLDVDGVSTRTIPADKIILGPPNPEDLLEIRYGLSATALELVDSAQAEFSFEDAAGIVGVVIKEGPPFRQFTFVDAVGMPILKDARKLMVLDVVP